MEREFFELHLPVINLLLDARMSCMDSFAACRMTRRKVCIPRTLAIDSRPSSVASMG